MKLLLLLSMLISPATLLAEPVKYADSFLLESKAFNEKREIMVSLPESYEKSTNSLYPVIYTVRGQLDMLSVVASLDMLESEVPEFIIVGISGKGAEFSPTKDNTQSSFSKLLHNEVVPYINKEFRVAPINMLVGHSNAGRFVVNDWLDRGSDFSNYLGISPSLDDEYINKRAKSIGDKALKNKQPMMISIATEGPRMQTMFDELEALYSSNDLVKFKIFPEQTHMSTRVSSIMSFLRDSFNDWKPSNEIEMRQFDNLLGHYQALSKKYGYEVGIPLDTMLRMSGFDSLSSNEARWNNAKSVVKYALSMTPSNVDAFLDIANQLLDYGPPEGSKRLTSYICDQVPDHTACQLSTSEK